MRSLQKRRAAVAEVWMNVGQSFVRSFPFVGRNRLNVSSGEETGCPTIRADNFLITNVLLVCFHIPKHLSHMSKIPFLVRAGCLILGLFLVTRQSAHAQRLDDERAGFRYGDYSLSAGVGFGMDYGFSPAGTRKPALALMLDRGAIEMRHASIGIGGMLAYKAAAQQINEGRISSEWSCITAAARATFHVTALSELVPALDAYGGVMAGAQYWHYTDNYSEAMGLAHKERGVRPVSAPFIGLKCSIKRTVGIWVEAGWDVAAVKGGAHLNF